MEITIIQYFQEFNSSNTSLQNKCVFNLALKNSKDRLVSLSALVSEFQSLELDTTKTLRSRTNCKRCWIGNNKVTVRVLIEQCLRFGRDSLVKFKIPPNFTATLSNLKLLHKIS